MHYAMPSSYTMEPESTLKLKLCILLQRAAIVHKTEPWLRALQMLKRQAGLHTGPERPNYPFE